MLKKDTDVDDTEKVSYSAKHELVSISICSNVPGFTEPVCFILDEEGQQKKLVKKAIEYFQDISNKSALLLQERFNDYIKQIKSPKTKERFRQYISQLPVVSFNGAKYDLKVLRIHLIPVLVEMDSIRFVIKKGTSYMAILTDQLRFLDVTYYIAPTYNYSQFLAAYGVKEQKGFFPYEWFTSLDKLKVTEFPSYEDFNSSHKSRQTIVNNLEPEEFEKLSDNEINVIGRIPSKKVPLTKTEILKIGQYRYNECRTLFYCNHWSMKEYLEYYNNLDVVPFLAALHNLSQYYMERKVDVFKDGVSGNSIF